MYLPSICHYNFIIIVNADFDRLSNNDLVIYSSALCVQLLCSSGLSLDALDDSSAKVAESNLCIFHQFTMIIWMGIT